MIEDDVFCGICGHPDYYHGSGCVDGDPDEVAS